MLVRFVQLARVEEVPPGQTLYFGLESGPVVLANYEGTVHALSGVCLHKLNPLDGATLRGPHIDCPYHHYQYDVRTGANHYPQCALPKEGSALDGEFKPLRVYPVEVRDGEIWVNIGE